MTINDRTRSTSAAVAALLSVASPVPLIALALPQSAAAGAARRSGLATIPAGRENEGFRNPTPSSRQSAAETAPVTELQPAPTRTIIAEGHTIIGVGGLTAARKAAIVDALRSAVEQTAGVYVTAQTLVRDYQLIHDDVTTHAEGFATVEKLLDETDSSKEVHVVVRVQVALRPFTQALRALNLTRALRVHLQSHAEGFQTAGADTIARNALEKALLDAGMGVVATDADADIIVELNAHYFDDRTTEIHGHAARVIPGEAVNADLRIINQQTGDIIALLTGSYTQRAIFGDLTPVARGLVANLGPRLTNTLLIVPRQSSEIVQLRVDNLGSLPRAVRLETDLATLPEILSITRRRYDHGSGFYELQVFDGDQNDTANDLETNAGLKSYHLTVLSDILGKITAAADMPTTPVVAVEPAHRANP